MSVESATSVSVGASAPSFSGEGFSSSPSFASSPIESGGSAFGAVGAQNIFSETAPFSGSIAAVPEMSPNGASDIFSDSWSTLAKTESLSRADSLQKLGFEPFVADAIEVSEAPAIIDLNNGEWTTIANNPKAAQIFDAEPSIAPKMDLALENGILQEGGLSLLSNSSFADRMAQAKIKEAFEQAKLSEKVVDLFLETCVYNTEREARERVREIVSENKGLIQQDVIGIEGEVELETQTELSTDSRELGLQANSQETQVGQVIKDEDEEDLIKNRKQAPIIDEEAQSNRKRTVNKNIVDLFDRAKRNGDQNVSSGEVTKGLDSDANKSYLLTQMGMPFSTDGSLQEAAREIAGLGKLDLTSNTEQDVIRQAESVLDANVPVKIADSATKQVNDKEIKKVLKYFNNPTSVFV